MAKDHGALCRHWIVPPFSVLDARQGYWNRRKAAWRAMGIEAEAGRAEDLVWPSATADAGFYEAKRREEQRIGRQLTTAEFERTYQRQRPGSSLFDPVLAELAYRWFCPPGGHVLDPFAGESVKGIVAAACGCAYTGVELRREQVLANRRQARRLGLRSRWIVGDAARLDALLPKRQRYDLVFTSPPYYDLETYGGGRRDGSGLPTFPAFMEWLAHVLGQAAARLRDDRFLVLKVGEMRDRRGELRDFVGETVRCLREIGLAYVNDAVLLTPLGSLPVRAGRAFAAGRKLGRCHQTVLVFYNGDPRHVGETFERTIENTDPPGPGKTPQG